MPVLKYNSDHSKHRSSNGIQLELFCWYHGMSMQAWQDAQVEGVLFGYRGLNISRCTYLTPDPVEASCYGDILLEVQYNPLNHLGRRRRDSCNRILNNYEPECWQMRVYEPILLQQCRLIDISDFLPNPITFTMETPCYLALKGGNNV